MAGSGMIIGGLLGGLGKGMEMSALQAREDALEELRQKRALEAEQRSEQRVIASEGRLEGRVMRQEERAEGRDVRKTERDYTVKTGLLALANKYKMLENETEQEYKIRLEKIRQAGDKDLAILKSGLDRKNDAASIALKAKFDAGEVDSTEVDENGNFVILYKNGKTEVTNIKAKPTASEIKADEEDEAEARRAERRAARDGKKPEPTAAKAPAKPKGKPVSESDYNSLYSQAAARAQRGEPGYKGLDAAGIDAKVKGILRKNGYAI